MQAKLEAFLDGPRPDLQRLSGDRHIASRPATPAPSPSTRRPRPTSALQGHRRPDRRATRQPLSVGADAARCCSRSAGAKEAEPAHRKSVELKPDAPLLRINLGQALIAEDDPKQARGGDRQHPPGAAASSRTTPSAGACCPRPMTPRARRAWRGWRRPSRTSISVRCSDARTFAVHARELLKKGSPEWRRATDIILASKPDARRS